jgi:endoglucanase
VKADRYGNIVVRYRRGNRPKPVALAGHMDHPGFEVLGADGREVTARWDGACDPQHFPGSRVIVCSAGEQIPGKVTSALGKDRTFTLGTSKTLHQVEGAFGHWRLKPFEIRGDRIYTKGADNLASCAAILAAIDRLNRKKADADLWGVFTRAEETGFVGAGGIVDAGTVPKRVPLIVLETSLELPGAVMGDGPVIRVGDRMSLFDPRVEYAIHAVARELEQRVRGFAFQRQLMSGGSCEASLYMLHGMAVGALAFPLGGFHNIGRRWPVEEHIAVRDAQGMVDLCAALALNPPAGEPRASMKRRLSASFREKKKLLLR